MLKKIDRINAIKEEINENGLLTLCKSDLAKKYDVSRQTIYNDIKEAVLDIDPQSISVSKFIVDDSFKRSLLKVNKIIEESSDKRLILQSIEIQRRLLDSYNSFLENFKEGLSINEEGKVDADFLQQVAELDRKPKLPGRFNVHVVNTLQNAHKLNDEEWREVCRDREVKRLENDELEL